MKDENLRLQLHRAGLRVTAPRLAVLTLLHETPRPLSHLDVTLALAGRGFDRATLYRNLLDLTRTGLARRTELGDRVWRFQAADAAHAVQVHPHFVCTACGEVQCLPRAAVSVRAQRSTPLALRRGDIEVQLRGVCDRCHPGLQESR
jgi:Fur family transcriptional regulator, ferric uptake regulator